MRGHGTLIHNTCRPTCQAGNTVYRSARVSLGRRRTARCGTRTIAFYTRMSGQWRVPHTRHTKTLRRTLLATCATR